MLKQSAFAFVLLTLSSACANTAEDGAVATDFITKGDVTANVPAIGYFFGANRTPVCTGVLIAPDVVLTARHCFPSDIANFGVSDGRSAQVSQIVLSDTVDLAYLVLKQAFRNIRLAQVRRFSHRGNCDYVGLGYGSGRKEAISLCADAGLTTTENTADVIGTAWIRAYTETASGTCFGDSGGPLRIANTMSIVGILGYGVGTCGDATKQSFYTPLANNLDFVDRALAQSTVR